MRRDSFLLVLLAKAGCIRTQPAPLGRAAGYLWKEQADDGGWHSKTYGLLASGQSLTPFVLDALLQVPHDVYRLPEEQVHRSIAFICRNTRTDGALGLADPRIPDYPNYSTALAVTALCRARRLGWEKQVREMVAYLRGQQFTEENGWHEADRAYGAWGMGGERRTPPNTGHVDLSMTRYVLDALRASGVAPGDPCLRRARVFVERCQNFDPERPADADGGFFFSTTEHDTNKAGHDGRRFRSYGTTTADGILALIATGADRTDPGVTAAQRWLISRHRDMYVPGFVGQAYERWPRGLSFYYAASSTAAFEVLNVNADSGIFERLKQTQRVDGSWANSENLVKEDDPYIATAFAIRALASGTSTSLKPPSPVLRS